MKLQTSVNELVLSNVATTGEFRIRNSAKAFSILSSGLYSNKIKAIIRELSCNAIDSHSAAGKIDVPFDVHLPSTLEPWFSVRDYGVGLDFEGVTQIYTTYFESTKTDSNQFIGALGLGSKSPFSYTDNFSITAIKDGKQRIFTAFINEAGIPSVAEMGCFDTDECNGVEVKFSVSSTHDYNKFRDEARDVFMWFEKPPKVDCSNYTHYKVVYSEKDIIPGVHMGDSMRNAMAVMGNIAYPLSNFPNQKEIGELASFLNSRLILHFDIGELDFAASREELSYIPSTIASITAKLQKLSDHLVTHVEEKMDKIDNMWLRAFELNKLFRKDAIFRAPVAQYIKNHKFKLLPSVSHYGSNFHTFRVSTAALYSDYKITVQGYSASYGRLSIRRHTTEPIKGSTASLELFLVDVSEDCVFVLDDLKNGASSRAKAYYRDNRHCGRIFILRCDLNNIDDRLEQYKEFLKVLHNPPKVINASTFPKTAAEKKSKKSAGYLQGTMGTHKLDWCDLYNLPKPTSKVKYIPVNAFAPLIKDGDSYKAFKLDVFLATVADSYLPDLTKLNIIGVRKRHLKEVETLSNWQSITDYYAEEVNKLTEKRIELLVMSEIFDNSISGVYTNPKVAEKVPVTNNSKYLEIVALKNSMQKLNSAKSKNTLELCKKYHKTVDIDQVRVNVGNLLKELKNRYPILSILSYIPDSIDTYERIAEYITLVDSSVQVS